MAPGRWISGYESPICSFEGCGDSSKEGGRGLCSKHYQRLRRHGDPAVRLISETGNAKRKAGRYNFITVGDRRVREHRHVMEQHLGRPIETVENVHHINGDRLDNRLENLELWSKSQPAGQRVEDKIAWARDLLNRYEPTPEADFPLDMVMC